MPLWKSFRFLHGVWSPCSEKCGGGQQYRNLTCVQVVSKNVTHVLPDSECSHLSKPAAIQQCNNLDCLPEWYTGNWTQVGIFPSSLPLFVCVCVFLYMLSSIFVLFLDLSLLTNCASLIINNNFISFYSALPWRNDLMRFATLLRGTLPDCFMAQFTILNLASRVHRCPHNRMSKWN